MRTRPIAALLLSVLVSLPACSVANERRTSLPADPKAIELGPLPASLARPKFLLAADAEPAQLRELVPFQVVELVLHGARSAESCAHFAIARLVTDRPDAILVFPEASKVTGVQNHLVFAPYVGMVSFATPTSNTAVVGYAMRAARARLPFEHDLVTGMVHAIHDSAAAPGLIEGDTITTIDGEPARPPKRWPEWTLYPRMLAHTPGSEVAVEWIRPGKGRMQGTMQMLEPLSPHLRATDSIDTRWMPPIEVESDGARTTWRLRHTNWRPPDLNR
jgi:hypothetical protein